jgi:spore coat protein CotH
LAVLLALALRATAQAQTVDDLFNPDVVHDIQLRIHSTDWAQLQQTFRENTYYPCDFVWQGQTVRNVGIRSRGLGSRSSGKPGLRVDFDRYSLDQTFLGLKSVVLDNLTQDPSTMREFLTMRVFQRMGLPASREAFVRLSVNGQFIGLYTIVESVDKDFLKRTFGENDGYLFEYNWLSEYDFQYLGSDPEFYRPIFDPKTHETSSAASLFDPIEAMIRIANEVGDASFQSALSEYLDLALLIKHVALEAFVAEDDGIVGYAGLNNFYFYRFERSTRSQFIVWDKDNALTSSDFPVFRNLDRNVIVRRAYAVDSLKQAYLDTITSAADNILEGMENNDPGTGWLAREIERVYALVANAALQDPNKPYSNEEFEAAVSGVRAFARERSAFVRSEVAILTGGGNR